jgi:muramoyltetrapeptide carboxypeptidase LdcA involved in peptidoglycan recycling
MTNYEAAATDPAHALDVAVRNKDQEHRKFHHNDGFWAIQHGEAEGPIIGNCDFGHMTPILTLPIGGRCKLLASNGKAFITITEH